MPDGAALIEFGSGSSQKARILLAAAPQVGGLCAGRHFLRDARRRRPTSCGAITRGLTVLPVETDFTKPFRLPAAVAAMPRAGFFPGSTIGNFEPHEACSFLRHAGRILGQGAILIIGVDLVKDAKRAQCRLRRCGRA